MNTLQKTDNNKTPMRILREDIGANGKLYAALLKADEQGVAQFMAEAFHAVSTNPKLLDQKVCNRGSLLMALGNVAALGLSVSPTMGEAWLIPRGGLCHFQVGYKGLVKLAHRSNQIDSIYVDVVYQGEVYSRRGGTDPKIEHLPDDTGELRTNNAEDILCAYAVVWVKGSSRPIVRTVPRNELTRTARSSGNPKDDKPSDVWLNHPEAMARKTALIRVAPMLPREDKLRALHMAAEYESAIDGGKQPTNLHPDIDKVRQTAPEPDGLEAMMAAPRTPAQDETQVDDE